MKKITSLIAIVTMASMMYAQCDVVGNYRVTALDVQYYDIASCLLYTSPSPRDQA